MITQLRAIADALRIKLGLPIIDVHAAVLALGLIHPKTGAVVLSVDPVTGLVKTEAGGTFDPLKIQTARVTLTNAQVTALRATPATLVAAPGAGKALRFRSITLFLKYGSAGYTESTYNLAVKYNNGAGLQLSQTIETTGFIDQTADTMTTGEAGIDKIVATATGANKALVLHNLGGAEFGGGSAGSSLVVEVAYQVISVP